MKTLFLILLVVHGLIHLLGFIKAFDLAAISQLTIPISKPNGLLWLLATILLLCTAVLMGLKVEYWWVVGLVAILLSQIIIFSAWQDAKFGSIANLIILAGLIVAFANWSFHGRYQNDVGESLLEAPHFPEGVLTASEIQSLPLPVQKYIRYAGCLGKPRVNNFRLRFSGQIRKDEQSAYMPFSSEQVNFLGIPTRLFFMKASMKHLPVEGYHRYVNGKAFMDIRLFSLFRVQFMDGQQMDVAETVTCFNDMCCMAPSTLIDKRITWLETKGNEVSASFSNNGITITAKLYFNDAGELVNFTSQDRYAADAGKQLPWATPLHNYQNINGYRLATQAELVYTYPNGDFTYGQFTLEEIEYNIKVPR